jgi:RHS repeat-associated protein
MKTAIMAGSTMSHRQTTGRKRRVLLWMMGLVLAWAAVCAHAGNTVTTVTLVMTDTQGNVLMTKDPQGHILARYTYRPYGTQQSGPTNAGPGYTGHVNDPGSGLVYMQQRYYDPGVGRFLSPDPIGPAAGNAFNFNRYAYANNNPVVNTDPDGQNATAFIGGLFVESWHGITGQGFNGSRVVGALKDGYNGQGDGRVHAAVQDLETATAVAGVAGAIKGGAALITRYAAKKAIEEGSGIADEAINSIAKRPSSFRKKTVQDAWDNAAEGSKPGAKACPTCGKDVEVAPGKGRRDWDVDHQPKWKDRDLSGKDRKQVLDEYNKNVRLRCPSCNRSDN